MGAEGDDQDSRRRAEFMQALTTEHFALQSARSATISESAARSSLYLTTVSSSVVALALVAQVSQLGQAFFIFSLAILPVVFFLGLVTYGRLLQTGVEDTIYARAISRIRRFYEGVDPVHATYFHETHGDREGLETVGLVRLRWQQFLSAAAMVAMVNAVVGGVFVAIMSADLLSTPVWAATAIGALATLFLAVAFLRHQWRAWGRVNALLPADLPATGSASRGAV